MTPQPRIKPDDIAPPIDIRLIPAAALTATVCLVIPILPLDSARWLPVVLVVIGSLSLVAAQWSKSKNYSKLVNIALLVTIACWLATPAALFAQHQRAAAEDSGWLEFVAEQGSAQLSVQLVTEPVQRDGPFGPNWFVTGEVQHFGKDLDATNHPARIVVSGDESLAPMGAEDHVCFIGRITDNGSSVFVNAVTPAQAGTCDSPETQMQDTGRDVVREALRSQAGQTISHAPELLPGLILGDRSQQSQELDEAMKVSGLSHLSAVSGAHTSLIATAATVLFRTLRLPRPVVIAAFLCTLVLFVQIVGMQPSIIRAATMGAIGAWALFFGRGSQALPILALSTIVLLTISPQLIHEVGFQLSVAATAGIVLGAQPLERWLHGYLTKFLPDFWASLLSSSLAISTAAQLACQPILLTFIDYVSLYSLLANLLATPLLPLITVPGTIAAALSVIAPSISQLILHLVALPASGIGWVATSVTALPGAMLPWPEGIAGGLLVLLHWAASAVFIVKLLRLQRQPKPPVKVRHTRPRWHSVFSAVPQPVGVWSFIQYLVIVVAFVAHVAAFWPTKSGSISHDWDVIGCDVGQGDMFLVRTGEASAMVIDTGEDEDLAEQCLVDAEVETIDLLVITHLHADHVGAIEAVIEHSQPEQILYSTSSDPTYLPDETGIPSEASQANVSEVQVIDHAAEDDQHPVQVRWTVLGANTQTANENNASVVLFVEIYRHGGVVEALFTGDLEEDEAARMLADDRLPENIDILKLSHHGAQNGGTEIIEHTRPDVALIGVGAENTYGHPHDDILEALGPRIELRRTDQDGTFSVTFEHNDSFVAIGR